jgi:DNA-binding NarL/FixJ family response regulator
MLVADGKTNREVGAQLDLSPKTIEWHLGHVYGKLGIRSRTELGRALETREAAPIESADAALLIRLESG